MVHQSSPKYQVQLKKRNFHKAGDDATLMAIKPNPAVQLKKWLSASEIEQAACRK